MENLIGSPDKLKFFCPIWDVFTFSQKNINLTAQIVIQMKMWSKLFMVIQLKKVWKILEMDLNI